MSLYRPAQSPVDSGRRDAPSFEPHRGAWTQQPPPVLAPPPPHHQYQPQQSRLPEARPEPVTNFWDEEGSDSDVSRTIDPTEPVNRILSPKAAPRPLPPLPSSQNLSSLDEIQSRLKDLESIEDHNARKFRKLQGKRKRKDDRVAQRRALEDDKIRAVMEARARKDERVANRRQREDAAFRAADQQLESDEMALRRLSRNLKRGVPVDDFRQDGGNMSGASMSPPMPQYQGAQPPKRHQSGPPGQNDSPVPAQARPSQPSPATSTYHFYQPSSQPPSQPPTTNSSYTLPYPQPPTLSHVPYHDHRPPILQNSTSTASASSPRPAGPPTDAPGVNGFGTPSPAPASFQAPPPSGPIDTRPPPNNAPTYDTRPPPPPPSSGFTSVNAGPSQTSGFAAVNSRGPGYASSPPLKPVQDYHTPKSEGNRRISGKSPKNYTPGTMGGLALNKRTPSTTHPYQASEAFQNRHHHCERTDGLNRGIWTSYGHMGSRDVPTGPPVEMYLRCNHDDCKRIDWRTVHGLQCHIVKSHEQPKGTIGSLEKALAVYGVPVSEIEEHEKIHGLGSAGRMADPKNLKIKNKTREAMQNSESPASVDTSTPNRTPSAYPLSATPLGGSYQSSGPSREPSDETKTALKDPDTPMRDADSSHRQLPNSASPAKPINNGVLGRNTWSTWEPAPIKPNPEAHKEQVSKPGIAHAPIPSISPAPSSTEAPDRTRIAVSALSDMGSATAAAVEMSKPAAKPEPIIQAEVASENPPLVASSEPIVNNTNNPSSEPKPQTPPTPSEVPADVTSEEPKENLRSEVGADPAESLIVVDAVPPRDVDVKVQAVETPHQPPATPTRRMSRRESVTLSKSAQKEAEASSMPSPKMSKAESKRNTRRSSVAKSTTSVSANVSVDGQDGDGEKSGDEGDKGAEKAAEKESAKIVGSRRNATGRFLRKGR